MFSDFIWENIFFLGTELDDYEKIFEIDWDFNHLIDAFSEDGFLFERKIFLFGQTEPQQCKYNGKLETIIIPTIIAVECAEEPSLKVRVESVQMKQNDRQELSLKRMKLSWVPFYLGSRPNFKRVQRINNHGYYLNCSLRATQLKRIAKNKLLSYTYAIPYIQEELIGKRAQIDKTVLVDFEWKEKQYKFDFRWDDIVFEYLAEDVCSDLKLELCDELAKIIVDSAKKSMEETKNIKREEVRQRREKFSQLPTKYVDNFKKLKCYKFYPLNEDPEIEMWKSPYINRYYPNGEIHNRKNF
ncbi:protein heat intolerant 4-related [Anaeramoeba flamelloides]|uniref:Protein heat intolerant 4-related n=1 Tax=Anaeramoeba flamelloides TaxID=1746091 RepID=A0AAV7Z6E0_9EUKA|nr:protein heat intolerant 4-related [Anaeramoeba flamelloides]